VSQKLIMETSRKRPAEQDLEEPLTGLALAKKRLRATYGDDGEYNNPDCIYGPTEDDEKRYDLETPGAKYDSETISKNEGLKWPAVEWRPTSNTDDLCRDTAVFTQPGQEIDITDDRAAQQYVWDRLPLTKAQKIELLQALASA
jgi:hypothetical protein